MLCYIYICVCVYAYAYAYVCMCMCMCVCVCICICCGRWRTLCQHCASTVPALCHALCCAGEPAVCAHATDVNEAALVSAARNAALNGQSDRLSLYMPWELPRAVR